MTPDLLADLTQPSAPPAEERRELLDLLRDLCAGGAGPFVRDPVSPEGAAFPEPWEATPAGVATLLRRLAWHAGLKAQPLVVDRRAEAGPGGRRATTEIELARLESGKATFDLFAIGDDDVPGTLAHEIGVVAALDLAHKDAPFRAAPAPGPADLKRGSVAAVYLGLGAIAVNAAFQEYKGGTFKVSLGYAPLEHDIIKAGHLPMDALAFLVAVQAEVRSAPLPAGLKRPQQDAAGEWLAALAGRGPELRRFLGLGEPETWGPLERPPPEPLPAVSETELVKETGVRKARRVFRVHYGRSGLGGLLGLIAGGGVAVVATPGAPLIAALVIGGAAVLGITLGKKRGVYRCSDCLAVIPAGAEECPGCHGRVAGEIANRSQRLDHDEQDGG